MASSQVTKPVIPLEIWSTVFSNFKKDHEIVHLWTDCRHVCRQFRDDVERIFSIKHLRRTTITFDCGVWYNSEAFGGKVDLRSIRFGLDRLANEGETAVFKIEDCAEEFMSEVMQRVSYCIAAESTIERPGYLVCCRGIVNDTEVPDLAVDKRSREISFDWRAMFSQLLVEQKLNSYFLKQNLSDRETGMPKSQKLKEKVDRGETDMYEAMEACLAMFSRGSDESRKSARRARIRRQWEAEGQDCVFDKEFEEEEKVALAKLKEVQYWAGFEEFSDDEEEEEADSASKHERSTAKEEPEEHDENAMYRSDDDRVVEDDEDLEEDEDVNEDEDVAEENDGDADNDGGIGSDHHHEN